jgi:hypothetical protein
LFLAAEALSDTIRLTSGLFGVWTLPFTLLFVGMNNIKSNGLPLLVEERIAQTQICCEESNYEEHIGQLYGKQRRSSKRTKVDGATPARSWHCLPR